MAKYWVLVLGILGGVGCGAIFSSPRPSVCNYTLSPFGGGSGKLEDPYTICTVSHLMQVQNFLSSSFKQYADLDLAGNTTFTPIGSASAPFTGSYDGGGFKISNWTVTNSSLTNFGLFGVASGRASISNLAIQNFNFSGNTSVDSTTTYGAGSIEIYTADTSQT